VNVNGVTDSFELTVDNTPETGEIMRVKLVGIRVNIIESLVQVRDGARQST
jgi:hypothetical protein